MNIIFDLVKRLAKVELTAEEYNSRHKGLIQYLSCFCDKIKYKIIKKKAVEA